MLTDSKWLVIKGQADTVASELGEGAAVTYTLEEPGLAGLNVLVVEVPTELADAASVPATVQVAGTYETRGQALAAAKELANQ